eukprot:scaffold3812_cov115-Isochrysis_galbana.AAC.2
MVMGLTFPVCLGGVDSDEGLPVRYLCEDKEEMLGLVELAGGLIDPTGLLFASGVFLIGVVSD